MASTAVGGLEVGFDTWIKAIHEMGPSCGIPVLLTSSKSASHRKSNSKYGIWGCLHVNHEVNWHCRIYETQLKSCVERIEDVDIRC